VLDNLGDPGAMGAVDHIVEIAHLAGTVLLGEDARFEFFIEVGENRLMEFDVQPQLFPHPFVVFHSRSFLTRP
jgi:hypothetical protein